MPLCRLIISTGARGAVDMHVRPELCAASNTLDRDRRTVTSMKGYVYV